MSKKKDLEKREAQGRKSRQLGNLNQTRILSLLSQQPSTFTELHGKTGLSKPVLSNHLNGLREKGFVEKTLENDQIVYKLVSEEKVRNEIKADLFDIITYIFPLTRALSPAIDKFVENLTKAVVTHGKEKAYEEEIFTPLVHAHEKASAKKISGKVEELEVLLAIPENKVKKLSEKYPEAMKELLKEAKSGEN